MLQQSQALNSGRLYCLGILLLCLGCHRAYLQAMLKCYYMRPLSSNGVACLESRNLGAVHLTSGTASAVPMACMMAGCQPIMWPMAGSASATLEGEKKRGWGKRNLVHHV